MKRPFLTAAAALALTLLALAAPADENAWKASMASGESALAGGDYLGAITLFLAASRESGVADDRLGESQDRLGVAFQEQHNMGGADRAFKRAITLREKALGPESLAVAASLHRMGVFYSEHWLNPLGAQPVAERSLAIREKALDPGDPLLADSLELIAGIQRLRGQDADAIAGLQRALAIRERSARENPRALASTLLDLGNAHRSQKRLAEALPLLERAVAVDPSNATAYVALGFVYRGLGRTADATAAARRGAELNKERDAREKERVKRFGEVASEAEWDAHYKAGVKAYREKNLAVAESEFRLAVKEAEFFGGEDPRLGSSRKALERALGR